MFSLLNNYLFNLNDLIQNIVLAISSITAIASVISFFKSEQKRKIKVFVTILSTILIALFIYAKDLTEVPNVEGMFYIDAKNELLKKDLKFNNIKNGVEKYVISQSVKNGEIVKKNTLIELVLEEEENLDNDSDETNQDNGEKSNTEKIEELMSRSKGMYEVAISLQELRMISLGNWEEEKYQQYGTNIENVDINFLHLKSLDNGAIFDDFQKIPGYIIPELGSFYVFKEIPIGKYVIEADVYGYERIYSDYEINVTGAGLNTDRGYNVTCFLTPIQAKAFLPYFFYIINSSYEYLDIDNPYCTIKFDGDDLSTEIQIPEKYIRKGKFRFNMSAHEGERLVLDILSRDNGDVHYECSVILDEPMGTYIMVEDDGTARQIEYKEYLNGISK